MGRCLILANFECLGVKPMPAYLMLSGKKVKQKAEKLEFIGYGLQTKKYCLIDEDTLKVTIRRMQSLMNLTFAGTQLQLKGMTRWQSMTMKKIK